MARYIDQGIAELVPGVLFIDEAILGVLFFEASVFLPKFGKEIELRKDWQQHCFPLHVHVILQSFYSICFCPQ